MFQDILAMGSGGGSGTQEVYHDTVSQIQYSWTTGCKLSDITLFYARSQTYGQSYIMVLNDNGNLVTLGSGDYQTASVDANGYIVMTNNSAAARATVGEAWGWK